MKKMFASMFVCACVIIASNDMLLCYEMIVTPSNRECLADFPTSDTTVRYKLAYVVC